MQRQVFLTGSSNPHYRGTIDFSVNQFRVQGGTQLIVTVLNCKYLPNLDTDGTLTDPYVKVFVLPGEEQGIRTDTVSDSLNPTFNRTFNFMLQGPYQDRELVLQVLDTDDGPYDDRVGEARITLREGQYSSETRFTQNLEVFYYTPPHPLNMNVCKQTIRLNCQPSIPDFSRFEGLGRITFKLAYIEQSREFTVDIRKCENLPNMDIGSLSDPYVIVSIISGQGQQDWEMKTGVRQDNLNPSFHEKFSFPVSREQIENKTLMFKVYDWDDDNTKGDFIGEHSMFINRGVLYGGTQKFVQELRKFYP